MLILYSFCLGFENKGMENSVIFKHQWNKLVAIKIHRFWNKNKRKLSNSDSLALKKKAQVRERERERE